MSAARTATANWITQYYLTVSSTNGTAGGTGWYNSSASARATMSPTTVSGTSGTRYVFTAWSGSATGTASTSDPITMDSPKNAIANWKTRYQVSFTSNPSGAGTVSPSADAWIDAGGSPISISASASSGYSFTSWSAPTGINIANPQSSGTTATITGPGIITANFAANPVNPTNPAIPEFELPNLILPLFMATTLLLALGYKRKTRKTTD
jgi:uncharacterized repeat protein (TIGR02543 family)